MSDSDSRRYAYYAPRVLIRTAHILDCPFPDSLVYLPGQQLALLRNLTQYLHVRSTFVSEYHQDYYLSPSDEEWDTLDAIIADLEDALMGNGADVNLHGFDGTVWRKLPLLWGYSDRYAEEVRDENLPGGYTLMYGTLVPAGEVWVVSTAAMIYAGTAPGRLTMGCQFPVTYIAVRAEYPPVSGVLYPWTGSLLMREGDRFYMEIADATKADDAVLRVAGYKMKVAE